VHFDTKFCKRLYDEFLAEPFRAVPPSPGLGSAAVLREPKLGVRPNATVPESLVEELADNPVEWIRHFTHFRVESWDRELAVSGFLHLGCDNRMLYVEWNALVLYPIRLGFWTVVDVLTAAVRQPIQH
jgi:hypothetical protein